MTTRIGNEGVYTEKALKPSRGFRNDQDYILPGVWGFLRGSTGKGKEGKRRKKGIRRFWRMEG